jgi:hypothetical protein
VILVDDIKIDKKKVVKKLYKFLGLADTKFVPKKIDERENVASASRAWFINYYLMQGEYFLIKHKLYFILKLLEDFEIRRALFLLTYIKNRKPITDYPEMKKETEVRLRKEFRSDIKSLEKLIKRDLSEWY